LDTVDYLVKEEVGIRKAGDEYQPHQEWWKENNVFNALTKFATDKTLIMVTYRTAGLGLVNAFYHLQQEQLSRLTHNNNQ